MPIGYLDVPTDADPTTKRELVKAMYDAMHEVYPFPDDTRIFLASGRSTASARTDNSNRNRPAPCSSFTSRRAATPRPSGP